MAERRHPKGNLAEQLAGNSFPERGSKTQVFGGRRQDKPCSIAIPY
jgi:hypothetical protein